MLVARKLEAMRISIISRSVNVGMMKITNKIDVVVCWENDHSLQKSPGFSIFTATCPAKAGQAQRSRYGRKGYTATVSAFICGKYCLHRQHLQSTKGSRRFAQIFSQIIADFFSAYFKLSPLLPTSNLQLTIHASRFTIRKHSHILPSGGLS